MRSTEGWETKGLDENVVIEMAMMHWLLDDERVHDSGELYYYWYTFPWNNPYERRFREPAEWDNTMRYNIRFEE